MKIATHEDIDRIESKIDKLGIKVRALAEGPFMDLGELADILGYKKNQSASKWLDRHPEVRAFKNGKTIRVNREDVYKILGGV